MPVTRERALAMAAIGLLALAPSSVAASDRVLCPIRRATGVPCPGCGLTRSWHALLHGRPLASVAFHPLGPAALAVVAAYGTGLDERPGRINEQLRRPGFALAFGAAWVGVWLVRLRAGWRGR